jgi:hypothetical protein
MLGKHISDAGLKVTARLLPQGKGRHYLVYHQHDSLNKTRPRHHTPQAVLLGLEGSDPETIDTGTIPSRYTSILNDKSLILGGKHRVHYDMDRDMLWRWDQVLVFILFIRTGSHTPG